MIRTGFVMGLVLAGCAGAQGGEREVPSVAVEDADDALVSTPAGPCPELEDSATLARTVTALEADLARMPAVAADRRKLLRCAAEGQVLLEAAARRDGRDDDAEAARRGAIRHYRELADSIPNGPELGEVLYYLAYEHEMGGDLTSARGVYQELLDKVPSSKYCATAHLAFAEQLFSDATGAPEKWHEARARYEKVLTYPRAQTAVWGYASYKLAYVHWNLGDYDAALVQMRATIEQGIAHPELPNATGLARSARRDIIPLYALAAEPPSAAFAYFAPIAGDTPNDTGATLAMLVALGDHLVDIAHDAAAVEVYRDVMARDADKSHCASLEQGLDTVAARGSKNAAMEATKLAADNRARCNPP